MAAGRVIVPQNMPAEDSNGARYGFAKMWTYEDGTTALKLTYADEALTTPNANPVIANSAGQFPPIWAEASEPVLDSEKFTIAVWTQSGEQLASYTGVSPTLDANTAAVVLAEAAAETASDYADDAAASAAEAAASADEAEAALAEIIDIAENAEDAPSVVNKANRNLDNAFYNEMPVLATPVPATDTMALEQGGVLKEVGAGAYIYGTTGIATTVAAAQALTMPASVNHIQTMYYSTTGDFGGALYKRVSAATTTNGYFTTADGAIWEYAEEVVKAASFGCKDDLNNDQYTAIQGAIDFMLANAWTREVLLPPGSFRINSPIIIDPPVGTNSVRNVRIRGTGGYNAASGGLPGSRIYYYGATTLDVNGGFQVISGYFISIEDICFRAQVSGLDCMVQVYAANSPAFSGVSTSFLRCQFSPGSGFNFRKGEVWVVDTKNTTFTDCVFTLGATVQRPAYVVWLGNTNTGGDSRSTLQNGTIISPSFYNCYFQGDVAVENVGDAIILGSTFGDMGNDNLGNSRGAAIVPVGLQRMGTLTVDSCIFADEDATVPAIKQGSYAPSTQTSEDASCLIVRNCTIRDRTIGVQVVRGWVEFSSNQWYPRNPGCTAVVIDSTTVGPVTGLRSQDWSQIMRDSDNPVAITDNRASIKASAGPIIASDSLAASPTAFTALATDTDIISVSSRNLPGQRIMWRISAVAYNPGIDAAEVKLWGSIGTTVTTPIQRALLQPGEYRTFSLSWVTAAAFAKATTLRLRGRQESGASYVQFLNDANGNTSLQVELWDG